MPRTIFAASLLLTLALASCVSSSRIRSDGLKGISLGDPMPARGEKMTLRMPARDTTFSENNFKWWAKVLKYPKGKVYLESDFAGGETLNRIRIETSDLELRNGLKVGSTWFDLRSKAGDWQARPYPEFGLIEAFSLEYPKIVFLLKDREFDFEEITEQLDVQDISPDAKVRIIVLM